MDVPALPPFFCYLSPPPTKKAFPSSKYPFSFNLLYPIFFITPPFPLFRTDFHVVIPIHFLPSASSTTPSTNVNDIVSQRCLSAIRDVDITGESLTHAVLVFLVLSPLPLATGNFWWESWHHSLSPHPWTLSSFPTPFYFIVSKYFIRASACLFVCLYVSLSPHIYLFVHHSYPLLFSSHYPQQCESYFGLPPTHSTILSTLLYHVPTNQSGL